ncbi:MAG: hypothetical protein HY958_02920 [Bacteroidia bacterium]|nr:hypothetical protein [Bacteroidia bacterium]
MKKLSALRSTITFVVFATLRNSVFVIRYSKFILPFVFCLFTFVFSDAQGTLDSSLVAKYYFNGNANDESGNGNNGTVNGAALTTDRFGNTGKAYNFDGVNNYIEIADNQVFHSLNQITLSVWFKANDSTNAWVKLIGKHYNASSGSFYLIWEHNYVRFSAITSFQYGGIVSGNLVDGNWHHAIGVYDGSLMSLYIDGLLVNSSANFGTINETNDALTIGRSESWNEYYNGLIDDIRIYNRALTPAEITALYYEGAPAPPTAQSASRCGSGSVTLTASGAETGEIYKWYDAPAGGNLLLADTAVVNVETAYMASLTTTDTFYVCIDSAGYLSARVPAIAFVFSPGQTITDTINKFIHDGRDCQNYPIVKIGNQWWMAEKFE